MLDSNDMLYTLISFLVVGIIFLSGVAVVFKILLKKYSVDNAKIKFYGLFLGLNNKQILSFSMISLNYLFLVYNLLTFSKVNLIVIVISSVLVILSDILILNYPKGFLNIVYEIISLLSLFVTNLLYNYVTEQDSVIIVICLIFVIILSVLFYSFVLFKTLNNIIVKDKHIKEEKYGL